MRMKNKFQYILLSLSIVACSDVLEEKPKSLAAEVFYNTAAEAEAAVNAIYGPMRLNAGFSQEYPAQLEGMADYCNSRGTQTPVSLYQGLDPANIGRTTPIWINFYASIRNANIAIKNLPKANQMTPEVAARYIAEAKFLRALLYFQLVRNWGGVPLRTDENMSEANVGRASIDDVYKLIQADAEYAEANLPDAPSTPLYGRPTKIAGKTLLVDILMHRATDASEWVKIRDKAQEVISSNKHSLVPVTVAEDFQKIYGPGVINTPEEIFYIKFSRLQGFGLVSFAHRRYTTPPYNWTYFSGGSGGFFAQWTDTVKNSVIRNWSKNDLRRDHTIYSVPVNSATETTSALFRKYRDTGATTNSGEGGAANDLPLYRYADLLLFHAEAASRANGGPTAEAMESLNKVHRRAYGYPPNSPSPVDFNISNYDVTTFIDLVVQERGYETMYEGKRWLDLKRLGIAKQRIKAVKDIDVAEKHMLWPIPTIEMATNKALAPTDQNPGY
jgi:hypothetical protein